MHASTHPFRRAHTHTYTHTRMHARTHTRTHARTHTHAHTHTRTHGIIHKQQYGKFYTYWSHLSCYLLCCSNHKFHFLHAPFLFAFPYKCFQHRVLRRVCQGVNAQLTISAHTLSSLVTTRMKTRNANATSNNQQTQQTTTSKYNKQQQANTTNNN